MDNKLKIILFLAKKREQYTLLELSKLVNILYTSLQRTIIEMDDIIDLKTKKFIKKINLIIRE